MSPASREHQYVAIVDDDADVRNAIRAVLKSAGYVARIFASAEEFIQSDLRSQAICLIADIEMSGMNGLALQAHISAEGRQLPTIFITAYGDPGTRAAALAAGAIDFLEKPLNDTILLDRIHTALARNERDG